LLPLGQAGVVWHYADGWDSHPYLFFVFFVV